MVIEILIRFKSTWLIFETTHFVLLEYGFVHVDKQQKRQNAHLYKEYASVLDRVHAIVGIGRH